MSLLQRDPDDAIRVLDESGRVVDGASLPDLDDDGFVDLYRGMRLIRHFDERAVRLQRQGRMGTFPPLRGQEAAQIGSAAALGDDDWVFPSYREHGVAYVMGMPLKRTLQYWMGDARGNRPPAGLNLFPIAVPIATQIPHATGAALAATYRDEVDRAFVAYFGDGATSEGDFHEGLNFAGVFDVPAVFFCNNNQWAISVPRDRQTAAETLAQKAGAYGFAGVQVDGMDPLAVYAVTEAALAKAKDPADGERRPTLIEAVQYRFGAHTTADDPSAYRSAAEVEAWERRDPVPRLESFLVETGRLDAEAIDAIEVDVAEEVGAAIEAAEGEARPQPSAVFEDVYGEPTPRLIEQHDSLERLRRRHGDGVLLGG